MIKKAICITLVAVLGACSNGEEAERSNSSISQNISEQSSNSRGSSDSVSQSVDTLDQGISDAEVSAGETLAEQSNDTQNDSQDGYDGSENEPEDNSKIALVQGSAEGQIEWQAPEELHYDAAEVVVVTPDGKRIKRQFTAGQTMALDESLPDGLYKWESVVTPELDPYVKEQMSSARESGDLKAQQQMVDKFRAQGAFPSKEELKDNRQSGAFVVRDGIATPTTTESSGEDKRG